MLTGESMPVAKTTGDRVIGGTINRTGAFTYRATTLGDASTLSQIVRLMREAQGSRAPIQQLADRVSGIFVPVVLGIALVTFAIWLFAGQHAGAPMGGSLVRAFAASLAVLIIACPCAMGLAVPTAIMVSSGRGAQLGTLIKGGDSLQRAAGVDTVVLDKTGTVTEGRPAVVSAELAPNTDADRVWTAVQALESRSEHPLATALVEYAATRASSRVSVSGFESRTGMGVSGTVQGQTVLIGNERLLAEHGLSLSSHPQTDSVRTLVFVAIDGRLQATVAIADPVKTSARAVVARLRRMNVEVRMLTGDTAAVARAVANLAGIDQVAAGLLPEGKVAEIRRLQAEGRVVAMAGDGINDAPALAQADVGIAIGTGADITAHAGDIVIMRGDPNGIADAIGLARQTMRIMRQNLFWAFVYNVIGIPIAAGILYPAFGVLLSPILASTAMAFSSVSVVANSLRLRTFTPTSRSS
jgi:Cu+-exporting ATPase